MRLVFTAISLLGLLSSLRISTTAVPLGPQVNQQILTNNEPQPAGSPFYPGRPIQEFRSSLYRGQVQKRLPEAHQLSSREKQQYIKDAFSFAWHGYKTFSWGADENRPVTNRPVNTRNGWGATIVDGLDTAFIMGLKEEFNDAREYVANINWNKTHGSDYVQVFETVIRYVGGLVSAYELSGDKVFIDKAVELVDRLLPAFDTPTGIPYQYVKFSSGKAVKSGFPEGASCLAEVGTIQLEFTRLSEITDDWTYHHVGRRVYDAFLRLETRVPGLYPHLINADTGSPVGDYLTWGGMADSFYEYLIKQAVMTRGKDEQMKEMTIQSIKSLQKYLSTRPEHHPDLLFLANLEQGNKRAVMDELACFTPGSLLLAARSIPELADIESLAFDLMHGCFNAWTSTRTGLAPEVFGYSDEDGRTVLGNLTGRNKDLNDAYGVFPLVSSYILRPETLESLFYFYRYTHDRRYQDMAWEIFNAIHTFCRGNSGFTGVHDVDAFYPKWDDRQESFFFAETLKYLYLIFEEPENETLDLTDWVFNTEAHPFRISGRVAPVLPRPPPPVQPPEQPSLLARFLHILLEWLKFIFVPYLQCYQEY